MSGSRLILKAKKGFSLLELLMVMVVVGILVGISSPGVRGVRRWLSMNESRALFLEIEHACRVHRMESGRWPQGLAEGEVGLNEMGAMWRDALASRMETRLMGQLIEDGFGNANVRLLVDADGDHWIQADDFEALSPEIRPEKLWARVVVYSLDDQGRLAASSW